MVVGDNESTATKNAGESMVISIVMAMQRYDARRIARWSTSRASLETTGCRHWSSAYNCYSELWSTLNKRRCYWWVWACRCYICQEALGLYSRTCRDGMNCQCVIERRENCWTIRDCPRPRLELESSAKFLAIKHCQRSKIWKIIKLAQSSFFKWAHMGP